MLVYNNKKKLKNWVGGGGVKIKMKLFFFIIFIDNINE